jgi:glycosyltransferase involved in cell wall biosynthesis
MKNNKPFVSVIMPVYNAGSFLVPAVESILAQTYQNFEFIIVDDTSTDSSYKILQQYKKRFPKKITLLRMHKTLNCGGDACANEALKIAKGKYIARMDADDISHATRLEKQVAFMEKNKNVFLVGSNAFVIDKNGKTIGEKLEPLTHKAMYRSYCTFHPLIHPTLMIRRVYKGKTFSYDIKYNANNDYYTFFKRICQGFVFANLPEKLVYYRIHGKNDTFVNVKGKFLNTLKIRFLMVAKYGYRPTPKDIIVSTAQSTLLFLLPQNVTTQLYLLSKGILKPSTVFIQSFSLK